MEFKSDTKERLLKLAATMRINLKFSEEPSGVSLPPERMKEVNEVVSKIRFTNIKELNKNKK